MLDVAAVLDLSRELQQASDLRGLLLAARNVVRRTTPYRTVWLGVLRSDLPPVMDLLAVSGEGAFEQLAFQQASAIPVRGDPMMEEILEATHPVVVVDARTDPRTNKAMVEQLGNRTIINVPLLIDDQRLGTLGIGTYAPEPPIPPPAEVLELLVIYATQVAAAFQRVKILEEQERLRRELARSQRLESLALLAGGVAHDFNNLLSAIVHGLSFVGEGPLTPPQRKDLDETMETCRRATELTRHLLAIGRRQTLRMTPLDLGARLRSLQRLLSRLIPPAVELVLDAPEGLPPVLGDEGQLDQVFVNLCLNARDAMPEGGRLTLRSAVVEDRARAARGGRQVCVTVEDTGSGMAPEVLERIYEPFFTTKGPHEGTGIGLAAAKGIVEQHGGVLECASAPGVGTTFRVLLPAYAGGAEPVSAGATTH